MISNVCRHVDEMQVLVATSNSRLRRRAPVVSMESLVDVAEEVRRRCRTECGDASPYLADIRHVDEGQGDQAEQEAGR